MDVLARKNAPRSRPGRYVYVPGDARRIVGDVGRRRAALVAQRRRTFSRLVMAAVVTLPIAALLGGRAWLVFLAALVALGGYVALLLRWKVQSEQAAAVVRRLPEVERSRELAGARRVAVGGDWQEPLYDEPRMHDRRDDGFPVATHPDEPWRPQSMVRIRRWEG
ncbi:MAG TPA: hypothetical protein VHF25_03630 [Nitriliruptorales bacterium]|nr:hypothetical protein [Nitriliruptorales bacterium]